MKPEGRTIESSVYEPNPQEEPSRVQFTSQTHKKNHPEFSSRAKSNKNHRGFSSRAQSKKKNYREFSPRATSKKNYREFSSRAKPKRRTIESSVAASCFLLSSHKKQKQFPSLSVLSCTFFLASALLTLTTSTNSIRGAFPVVTGIFRLPAVVLVHTLLLVCRNLAIQALLI